MNESARSKGVTGRYQAEISKYALDGFVVATDFEAKIYAIQLLNSAEMPTLP